MNRKYALSIILLLILVIFSTACSAQPKIAVAENNQSVTHEETNDHDEVEHDHADEHNMGHTHVEAPVEFAQLSNPLAGDHAAIEAGEETYNALCATCHGIDGYGDGAASETLDPKPANLADGMMMKELSDGYLYWRVSKGGLMEPFNSAMPSWEVGLTEDQRWQVISYVRTLAGDEDSHTEGDHHMDDNHHEVNDEHDN